MVSVFWANHITLHCMGSHFVSGASLHSTLSDSIALPLIGVLHPVGSIIGL